MCMIAPTTACVVNVAGNSKTILSSLLRSIVGTKDNSIEEVADGAVAPKVKEEAERKLLELTANGVTPTPQSVLVT